MSEIYRKIQILAIFLPIYKHTKDRTLFLKSSPSFKKHILRFIVFDVVPILKYPLADSLMD